MSDNPHWDDPDPRWVDLDAEPDCDHSEYEIDWNGRAHCDCGYSWSATRSETEAHDRWMRQYHDQVERENVWWRRLGRWCGRWLALRPFGNAQGPFDPSDDEIPF